MAAPFIFIGTYTLKEGKLEAFTQYCQEFCEYIQANEPRLIHFGFCIDEDGTEVSVVQVHPDADSMAFHMQLIAGHMGQVFDFLDTTRSVQIYGARRCPRGTDYAGQRAGGSRDRQARNRWVQPPE